MAGMHAYLSLSLIAWAAVICPLTINAAPEGGAERVVYLLPIKGEINQTLVYIIRRGLHEAQEKHAAAIVFEMDTPGGRVDVVEEILNLLKGVTVPTYTLVSPNAISAGSIIAMATDHIYMTPASKIGDARPVMLGMLGTPGDMPAGIEEKSVSYVAALIRAAAQEKGHDPKLAESMVRREVGFKIGDEVIVPTGQIATLTNQEAEKRFGANSKPLLSEGTVKDRAAFLATIGLSHARVIEFSVSEAEKLARIIESVSILLLAGGLLGLYIEFKTPGFGLPGVTGIVLLIIWFWGHHIAGLAGMEEIILFVIGLVLIALEVFIIPGFGVVGAGGILCVVAGLILSMTAHYPGTGWLPSFASITKPIANLSATLLLTLGGIIALMRILPSTRLFHTLVLESPLNISAGNLPPNPETLVGKVGITSTQLNPYGVAMFGDMRLEVTLENAFLDAGRHVRITSFRGNRIIVEPAGEM